MSADMVPELQVQLEDVETIINILLRSRVQSIESIQRNPVTKEDFAAAPPNDYLNERQKYTNSVAVVRPYRIKFRCLSGGIAKSLSGFASEDSFYVVRKFEVRQAGAASGGMGGEGGMGGGGEEVGGEGAGVPLAPLEQEILENHAGLATPKAKNIMREQLLEVTVDLDVIRRISQSSDPLGDLGKPLASEWNRLRAIASAPPAINLDGTNHLVFNATKWSRIINNGLTNVFRDSPDLPLGISALRVTEIREVRLLITPKIQLNRSPAKLGENNMRYRFEAIDEYPTVFVSLPEYMAYWRKSPNWQSYTNYNTPRMQSFMPQKWPWPANPKALSQSIQPHALRRLSPLHLFNDPQIRQHPDWFVGFRFTAATKADRIEDVICTLDIIHGLPGGGMVTNKNRMAKHNQPISFTRGYEADLFFQTKFTAQPMQWKNCRVGRRFSVDGEVFRILKVTRSSVQLVSDQEFGGNRQIYDKPFRPGPIQVRPGLNIPVPGGGTNAVPVRPPVANTNAPTRPLVPPPKK